MEVETRLASGGSGGRHDIEDEVKTSALQSYTTIKMASIVETDAQIPQHDAKQVWRTLSVLNESK